MFPSTTVIAGFVVDATTVPLTPLDEAIDTLVTEPVAAVPDVGAQDALIELLAHDDVPNVEPVIWDTLITDAVI
jgi:hypothetical protein